MLSTERWKSLWFTAQVLQVLSTTLFGVSGGLLGGGWHALYSSSLQFASVAYLIVIFIQFGRPKWNMQYWQALTQNENTQYLMLAFLLANQTPSFSFLIPFSVYSSFHVSNYARTHNYISRQWTQKMKHYETALQPRVLLSTAVLEILNLLLIASYILFGKGFSLLAGLFYVQFLRHRYAGSVHMQQAFQLIDLQLLRLLPSFAIGWYQRGVRQVVCRLAPQYQPVSSGEARSQQQSRRRETSPPVAGR